ncbi:hypothetical protein FJR48_11110 [Sulfurimonas lithotrophica]|uniref:Porin n=1 Tax=Sulfurimonas lithotrophica TaxID=2590022 RepID=A0A5P8P3C8_9BACT|nr:hypothetical protein [Sulfurimonas lithotrophica]QFR50248.1 hypothetical protein FJR48_11110 [Sulfurimonas lithotrophica]
MKKTLVSLAAVAAISTGAMAADKGVDLTTTGQAVIYYETHTDDTRADKGMFDKDESMANVGLQLNIGGDIGNGFTLGTQASYIGTLGLEKNLVSGTRADAGQSLNNDLTTQIMLSKIFVAKQIGNTTLKLGRQELPKSLSPLAYSEGWNVFKNTFDAIVAINTDIKDTTIVGAWVGESNDPNANYSTLSDLKGAGLDVNDGAYMLTVANKSIPMTALTASYYTLHGIDLAPLAGTAATATADNNGNNATALWIDAKIAGKDLPLGLNIGLQYGNISPDIKDDATVTRALNKDTSALGVKVGMKPVDNLMVELAYTTVDDGTIAVKNTGTGIKSPLFTQAIYNQDFISSDASTIGLKAAYNMGDMGKVIVNYNMTTDDRNAVAGIAVAEDYSELDLIYKVKAGGVTYWASAMLRSLDRTAANKAAGLWESDDRLRLWARYNF